MKDPTLAQRSAAVRIAAHGNATGTPGTARSSWPRRAWRWLSGGLSARELAPRLPASAALLAAFVVLRQQIVADMGVSMREAVTSGLVMGWAYDLLAVLMVSFIARALWAGLALPRRVGWIPTAIFFWMATLANVLHFRFFGIPLDWWIVELHWRELAVVTGSVADLSLSTSALTSGALCALAVLLCVAEPLLARRLCPEPGRAPRAGRLVSGHTRNGALGQAVGLLLVIFIWWRLPFWLNVHQGSPILKDHIVRAWLQQLWHTDIYAGAGTRWADGLAGAPGMDFHKEDLDTPSRVLAAYRDFREPETATADPAHRDAGIHAQTQAPVVDGPRPDGAGPPPGNQESAEWPLVRNFAREPSATRALRQRLGLPTEGPIHVLLLFVESLRAYELLHPELGPRILPRTREVLHNRAIYFTQAYASAFTAGQTVRGQFSTLCSMLPNMLGAATYIAHTTVSLTCLQGLLQQNGYQTAWMNSYESTFHQKRLFEQLHGTQLFFDETHFRSRGIRQRIGEWGLADAPVLQESLRLFETLAKQGPLFAHVLTISTHHPHSVVPEGDIPDDVLQATAGHDAYRGYLSRLRYADTALGQLFDAYFDSPVADRTLLVMLGDHSLRQRPHHELTAVQDQELRFRIPIALVTKGLAAPERITHPVHQVDVAPTIAGVVGARGVVSWVGRGLFEQPASPWVYQGSDVLAYRTAAHGCYGIAGSAAQDSGMRCFDLRQADPLFDTDLPEVPEDPAQSDFFRRVVLANMRAIVLNRVMPPSATHPLSLRQ